MAYTVQGQIYPAPPQLVPPTYSRPSDWLVLPTVAEDEEKFVGLFAVFNVIGNFIALQFEGDYTVDWGDGTIEDIASGVKAQHSYDYSSISPSTECSRGYRQVIVTVTPQTGQNLTLVDLTARHDNVPTLTSIYFTYVSTPWLDFSVSAPNAASGKSLNFFGLGGNQLTLNLLECCTIVNSGGATDFSYLLADTWSLQNPVFLSLPQVDDISFSFYGCYILEAISLPELPSVNNFNSVFESCYGLKWGTIGNLPLADYIEDTFYSCYSLNLVSFGGTPSEEFFSDVFSYCYSLKNVSFSDLSALAYPYEMFYGCSGLKQVYIPATPNLYDCSGRIFYSCYSLQQATFDSLPSLVNADYMFEGNCYSLYRVNLPDTPLLEESTGMLDGGLSSLQEIKFTSAPNLTELPYTDTGLYSLQNIQYPPFPAVTFAGYSFSGTCVTHVNLDAPLVNDITSLCETCPSLKSIALTDAASVTIANDVTLDSPTISAISMPNLAVNFSPINCLLSREAIVSLFNDLAAASATINVSGNYGAADLTGPDIAIATGKGWTVIY